jgi:hypothetical protein
MLDNKHYGDTSKPVSKHLVAKRRFSSGQAWIGVEWVQMARDRDRWRAVVNEVMNARVLSPRC